MFEAGDKVERTFGVWGGMVVGDTDTVEHCNLKQNLLSLETYGTGHNPRSFELVEKGRHFNIGDKVRLVRRGGCALQGGSGEAGRWSVEDGLVVGKVYTVCNNESKRNIKVAEGQRGFWINKDCFELVSTPKRKKRKGTKNHKRKNTTVTLHYNDGSTYTVRRVSSCEVTSYAVYLHSDEKDSGCFNATLITTVLQKHLEKIVVRKPDGVEVHHFYN